MKMTLVVDNGTRDRECYYAIRSYDMSRLENSPPLELVKLVESSVFDALTYAEDALSQISTVFGAEANADEAHSLRLFTDNEIRELNIDSYRGGESMSFFAYNPPPW